MCSQEKIETEIVSFDSASVPISASETCLLCDGTADDREVRVTLDKSFPFLCLCCSPPGWRTLRRSLPGNSSRPQTMEQVRPLEEEEEKEGEEEEREDSRGACRK